MIDEEQRAELGAKIAALAAGGGVRVVSVPNLFPTPNNVAHDVVSMAKLGPGMRVLEPSAGTGALLRALDERLSPTFGGVHPTVHAIESNHELAGALQARFPWATVQCADFLSVRYDVDGIGGDYEPFDRVLMNPPFERGADIKHVQHALRFLKPGGVLVGICANGPRQNDTLRPLADTWQALPRDTFRGTNVSAALFRIVT